MYGGIGLLTARGSGTNGESYHVEIPCLLVQVTFSETCRPSDLSRPSLMLKLKLRRLKGKPHVLKTPKSLNSTAEGKWLSKWR